MNPLDGEVVCKAYHYGRLCLTKLNRVDTICWRCGSRDHLVTMGAELLALRMGTGAAKPAGIDLSLRHASPACLVKHHRVEVCITCGHLHFCRTCYSAGYDRVKAEGTITGFWDCQTCGDSCPWTTSSGGSGP